MGIVDELDINRTVCGSLDHLIGTDLIAFVQNALDAVLIGCSDFTNGQLDSTDDPGLVPGGNGFDGNVCGSGHDELQKENNINKLAS